MSDAAALPEPIQKALHTLERQRWLARQVLGRDAPGCIHHPEEGKLEENLRRAVAAIERAGASWVLVGAEAVNLYAEPRATEDFDLVVHVGRFPHVLRELQQEFGEQPLLDLGAAVRFPGLGLDLIRSNSHALFRIALERSQQVQAIRVPPAEVIMALKFLAAVSPWRGEEGRKQDMLDLMRIYRRKAAELDRAELVRLAGMAYPGAEREITALLDQMDRGEEVSI